MTLSDHDRMLAFYRSLATPADEERFTMLVVEGDPPSKARPRFTHKGQIYTSKRQRQQERFLRSRFRAVFPEPWPGNIALGCVFFRRTRQRVDVDNMLKHVLDAANTICFADDVQVTALAGMVELDRERPRTLIFIGQHESSMVRGVPDIEAECETCGASFAYPYGRRTPKRFCSSECASRSRGKNLSTPVPCRQCGQPFKRINSYQMLCSEACRTAQLRDRHRARRRPPNICPDCGGVIPNYRAKQCRACWRRSVGAKVPTPELVTLGVEAS